MQSSHSSAETGGSYRSFAAMLDGRKNTISLLENEFMQSCHSTWLPCKLLKMADPSNFSTPLLTLGLTKIKPIHPP